MMFYFDFQARNKNSFQDEKGEILLQDVMLTDDGWFYFFAEWGTYVLFWGDQEGATGEPSGTMTLGPGQSAVGTYDIAGHELETGSGRAFASLLWPDGSYSFYELSSCTPIE
jgi:hypothetical protein